VSPLRDLLTKQVSSAFATAGYDPALGEVVPSQRPDLGQFQCSGVLAAAKKHRRAPQAIADDVIARLKTSDVFGSVSFAAPGFINLTVTDEFLTSFVEQVGRDERLGCPLIPEPGTVVLDFGGPNIAKAMHVGHLRSSIIGDSLQRLFRFAGHKVLSDIHLGDWGTPMGMLIAELQHRRGITTLDDATAARAAAALSVHDLEEMYLAAATQTRASDESLREALQATVGLQQNQPGYRELWRQLVAVSVAALREDFDTLGVSFDLWLGESHFSDRIPGLVERLLAQGHAVMSEGAVVIPVAEPQDQQEMPPLILVKSDGGYTYATTDLAAVDERAGDLRADAILYVVDKRQGLHFTQVFRAARKTGLARNARLEHLAFGTMNGPDGKPFKTRAGGVMKLKDLIDMVTEAALQRMQDSDIATTFSETERRRLARQVGLAALKFGDLSNVRTSDYVFDLDRFLRFEGRTGPYLQYAAVRIKSIFRKAELSDDEVGGSLIAPQTAGERDLMLALASLGDAVRQAYERRAPNVLCDFAHTLAQLYSHFYHECHILSEGDPGRRASWLRLSQITLRQLGLLLGLLGIEVPDRM